MDFEKLNALYAPLWKARENVLRREIRRPITIPGKGFVFTDTTSLVGYRDAENEVPEVTPNPIPPVYLARFFSRKPVNPALLLGADKAWKLQMSMRMKEPYPGLFGKSVSTDPKYHDLLTYLIIKGAVFSWVDSKPGVVYGELEAGFVFLSLRVHI